MRLTDRVRLSKRETESVRRALIDSTPREALLEAIVEGLRAREMSKKAGHPRRRAG